MAQYANVVLPTSSPRGAKRLALERGYDPTVATILDTVGRPDYLLVESTQRLRLFYVETDLVYELQRAIGTASQVRVSSGIPDAYALQFSVPDRQRLRDRREATAARDASAAAVVQASSPPEAAAPQPAAAGAAVAPAGAGGRVRQLCFTASSDLNAYDGRPHPLTLRVFQLSDADAFLGVDRQKLVRDDAAVPGLQSFPEEHVIRPAETITVTLHENPDATYVGVLALYRRLLGSGRATLPIDLRPEDGCIRLGANGIDSL